MSFKEEGYNILSLFDGMSCGQEALNRLGIPVANYFASEIDKHAISVAKFNFPDTIHLGDVRNVKASHLPKIDILLGGSPCQGFSFAGKQLAFDDPRSALFFEFLRIWEEVKAINRDAIFLLENVKMKKEHQRVINDLMGVLPLSINSELVSAQSRPRLYWTNLKNESRGLFGENYCSIPQPEDRKIYLEDVLEDEVAEKYFLSDAILKFFFSDKNRFNGGKLNIRDIEGKGSCDTASCAKMATTDNYIVAMRGRPDSEGVNIQQLEPRLDQKTNCLTSVQKDNLVLLGGIKDQQFVEGIMSDFGQAVRVYDPIGKSCCLNAGGGGQGGRTGLYLQENRIRRLTPIEAERLQTLKDGYTEYGIQNGKKVKISDTQRYRMVGNGWTVEAIMHIFKFLF